MKPLLYALLAISLSPLPAIVQADVLLVDAIAQRAAGPARPSNGATMDGVRARYGEPAERLAPVGDPPITRWIYDAFTVYFEYDRVITSVPNR
ncbi:MAG: hypothetical protein PVF91_06960 [Chromatiales bacterium]|jgi:hypothetical protein